MVSCLNLQLPKIEDFELKSKLCLLAKIKGSSISIPITYIVFVTKMQKRQPQRNKFTLFEKRYHNQLKRCQNSRYIADIHNAKAHRRQCSAAKLPSGAAPGSAFFLFFIRIFLLPKSFIRTFFSNFFITGLQPTGSTLFHGIKFFYIWFNIQ